VSGHPPGKVLGKAKSGDGKGTLMVRKVYTSLVSIVGLGGQESVQDAERVPNADLRHCYSTHTPMGFWTTDVPADLGDT
jgi:hypothetical protein